MGFTNRGGSRGGRGDAPGACPPKIEFIGVKIFHAKYPNNFCASLRDPPLLETNFRKYALFLMIKSDDDMALHVYSIIIINAPLRKTFYGDKTQTIMIY